MVITVCFQYKTILILIILRNRTVSANSGALREATPFCLPTTPGIANGRRG